jgi:hypothetical protein
MAPEQARGLPLALEPRDAADRSVLVAIDIWGLGAIAYELLSGKPPWIARSDLSAWEVAALANEYPAPLDNSIPGRLRRVIGKAMATDASARYATAAQFANELEDFLALRPTTLDRSRLLRASLWMRRNPQLALAGIVSFALTVLAVGAYLTVSRLDEQRVSLTKQVAAQKVEDEQLRINVDRNRRQFQETREKLATERANLASLEQSIAEDRKAYQALIDAKEQALRDATQATRKLVEQLDAARRDKKLGDRTVAQLQQQVTETRQTLEKLTKEREKLRKERDTARSERDALQKERDAAVADREKRP